jgi:hypothetical protein
MQLIAVGRALHGGAPSALALLKWLSRRWEGLCKAVLATKDVTPSPWGFLHLLALGRYAQLLLSDLHVSHVCQFLLMANRTLLMVVNKVLPMCLAEHS